MLFSSFLRSTLGADACLDVVGRVICKKDVTKVSNVEVSLYDEDSPQWLSSNDVFGTSRTNEYGVFRVGGCARDMDNLLTGAKNYPDPLLEVFHFCNNRKGERTLVRRKLSDLLELGDFGNIVLDNDQNQQK
ncbi:unnamed protein product [Soboliphyme baturini]|uniref:Transthyretin-like family protein n=1 Tax=Soboliphyme baturini TaxID=241478 RepID=A0A183JBD8_9BILA|nr:unnamed protein product [Soboliphyme baturini]